MPLATNLMGGGLSHGQASAIVGKAVLAAGVAAGTTQGTALALTADVVFMSTVAASSGVICPAVVHGTITIYNGGANALTIYPPVGNKINATAINGGITLAQNTSITLTYVSATQMLGNLSA